MSIVQLNTASPVVFTADGTMQYLFRDFLRQISVHVPPAIEDDATVLYTLVDGDANKVKRFTGASPAITIPPDVFEVDDEITIRQAGTGTLVLTTTGLTINGTIPSWAQHVEVKFRYVDTNILDVV